MQLVGLVLTYNFTNCDFKNIVEEYQNIIYPPLKDCINGVSEEAFVKQYIIIRRVGMHNTQITI